MIDELGENSFTGWLYGEEFDDVGIGEGFLSRVDVTIDYLFEFIGVELFFFSSINLD